MGKVEIGIYFCVTADILTKVLLKCFWSSPLPTISKSLILIGGHGNRKAKFSREKKNNKKNNNNKKKKNNKKNTKNINVLWVVL